MYILKKLLRRSRDVYTWTLTNLTNEQYYDATSDALHKSSKFLSVLYYTVALFIWDCGSSATGLSVFQIASEVE